MNSQQVKKLRLPDSPGVYFFKKGEKILYIGKATSLKDRVKSYFGKDLINTRGPAILDMVTLSDNIKLLKTDSVLEALILESNLIKKYKPKYNIKEKDDKSFNYVCIIKEKLPKILIIRGKNIDFAQKKFFRDPRTRGAGSVPDHSKNLFLSKIYGPFTNGLQLREAMKIIRRIFPYFDNDSLKKNNKEFYKQLGLVPENEYKNNIKNLKLFFEGKKKNIISNLKKEMLSFAKRKEFEKAEEIKKKIFALGHINDIALIKDEITPENHFKKVLGRGERELAPFRVEAYDVAHMSGKNMVGVMTVISNREVDKSEYKKFIIKTQSNANDTGALEEMLSRRFRHTEWGLPNLIVVDGSTAQINVAKRVLDRYQFKIPVVGVVKDDKHKAKAIIGDEKIIKAYKKQILLANSESHRFAVAFHKNRRNKNFL